MTFRASYDCIELIKQFEGFSAEPYLCSSGVPTVGFGSTIYEDGRHVTLKDPAIDETRATAIMYARLKDFEDAVNRYVSVTLNQHQFDALVDFAYNCGTKNLLTSTLLKQVNVCNFAAAANEFGKWTRSNGKILQGLVKRRLAERELFILPI